MVFQAKRAVLSISLCAALVSTLSVSSPSKGADLKPSPVAAPLLYKTQVVEPAASPIPSDPGGSRLVLLGCATMAFIVLRRHGPSL